jgi:HlyD family secretion protein
MSLPNTAEMSVEMKVHESSVDKIKPGQPARIVIDAFPDSVLTGSIVKIAPLPDQTRAWLNPDLKVYATQVSIDGRNDFLKPGMSAKVEVTVEELQNVIAVPIQAIINQSGSRFCYVQSGEKLQLRAVETGSFNDSMIQVVSGLSEGDEIALNPPRIIQGHEINLPKQKAQKTSAEQKSKEQAKKKNKKKHGLTYPLKSIY